MRYQVIKLLLRTSKTAQVAEGGLEGQFFTRPCTTNQMIHIELFPLFFSQCEHVSTLSLDWPPRCFLDLLTSNMFQLEHLHLRDFISISKHFSKHVHLLPHHVTRSNAYAKFVQT
jgi:hypothetical protein